MIVTMSISDHRFPSLKKLGFELTCVDLVESDGLCLLEKESQSYQRKEKQHAFTG